MKGGNIFKIYKGPKNERNRETLVPAIEVSQYFQQKKCMHAHTTILTTQIAMTAFD